MHSSLNTKVKRLSMWKMERKMEQNKIDQINLRKLIEVFNGRDK